MHITEAAEAYLAGNISETLYACLVRGALLPLPTPKAPFHVRVLAALKRWEEAQLIPTEVRQRLSNSVTTAAREPMSGASGSASAALPPVQARPPAPPAQATPRTNGLKTKAKSSSQVTLFSWPGAEKRLIQEQELRKQKLAAARGEDYAPEVMEMRILPSEQRESTEDSGKIFACPQCARTFTFQIGLVQHLKWTHCSNVKEKVFAPPPPKRFPQCSIAMEINSDCHVTVSLLIAGKTRTDIAEERAAGEAAEAERSHLRRVESVRRQAMRDIADETDRQERRKGSRARRSYTAKSKLKCLEVYDRVWADPAIHKKKEAFEADPKSMGVPYVNLSGKTGWAEPKERARISAAVGKEHRQTLLRIDRKPRNKGKYADMENEVYKIYKERRARGRKVSGRWISAISRQVMARLHPGVQWKGSHNFVRRFCLRMHLGRRRKTNAKNKTWADTEPVLLRYLAGLRRRLQLPPGELGECLQYEETEPEPEDLARS